MGLTPVMAWLQNDAGQVVRTRVPLLLSSIIWYRSKGNDDL